MLSSRKRRIRWGFFDFVYALFLIGLLILVIMILSSVHSDGYNKGFKKGQIDCLTDNIKFERVTHPDQTVTWELIEKKEKEKEDN